MTNDLEQGRQTPPEGQEKWRELEHSGCFYCDKPWDHYVNPYDSSIHICLACYESRFGSAARGQQSEQKE